MVRETTGLSYVSVAYHVEGILSALSARAHLKVVTGEYRTINRNAPFPHVSPTTLLPL